ncbi:MAG TPA: hypothetical protein PKY77_08365 [Phycisphaerae bacterium]|nr:hypothetical protein [Phycisphaerae bacterium]HRY68706.1 hypothetical protein [Phycisphaerae bacterium]HSA25532.1 hypothetical protein [Phycisphaerae bacterium]
MARVATAVLCIVGSLALLAAVVLPFIGIGMASLDRGSPVNDPRIILPSSVLLTRSVTLSTAASVGALVLGLWPAAVLGSTRRQAWPLALGLTLTPLLVPPQVYAYAWGLLPGVGGVLGSFVPAGPSAPASGLGAAAKAGVISAGWLWPVVALIVAVGWRAAGRSAYALAVLDTTPARAWWFAVLPSLRPYMLAAGCAVFAVTLTDYAIPHFALARVYATELMALVDIAAAPGEVVRMAAQPVMVMAVLGLLVGRSLQAMRDWHLSEAGEDDLGGGRNAWMGGPGSGLRAAAGASLVWMLTLGMPVAAMFLALRRWDVWGEAFSVFSRQWRASLQVAALVAAVSVLIAIATVLLWRASRRHGLQWPALAVLVTALMPPAAMGIGLIMVFNRPGAWGYLYDKTLVVWCLGLIGRYSAIVVLVAWLATSRQDMAAVEQARSDGADGTSVLAHVLLPAAWPALLAGGLIVGMLSLFEIVMTQVVGPVGYPSLAVTILNHMHYGRDDMVIATSLAVLSAGVVVTLVAGWLFGRGRS